MKMTDALIDTLDDLETEVMEALDNPYRTYSVKFSYQVSFSFPDDDHHTQITIQSTSEILRYGRDEHDIHMQMELDQDAASKYIQPWNCIGVQPILIHRRRRFIGQVN